MSEQPSTDRPAATTRTLELVVAVIIFLLASLVVFDSVRLGFRWGSDGPQSGYFPFYIGMLICISSVVIFFRGLRSTSLGQKVFVYRGQLKLILQFMVPAVVYALLIGGVEIGPLEWDGLGIYVASTAYIAFFMIWLGKYSWTRSLAVAFGVMVVFFLVFEVWFKVPLPKGPVESLIGLG